ncbi:hypothetical protein JTE90_003289 [Oedothorax gibbosus]|uniref:Uncharacterized protein n=1 Tax=Oedothorax gibbosus TaxID=931172 RepID=A0AAV6V3L5_9ARAC|nr:hypothetical protein JTE90_003289 [Oedothorax gibbosus]
MASSNGGKFSVGIDPDSSEDLPPIPPINKANKNCACLPVLLGCIRYHYPFINFEIAPLLTSCKQIPLSYHDHVEHSNSADGPTSVTDFPGPPQSPPLGLIGIQVGREGLGCNPRK